MEKKMPDLGALEDLLRGEKREAFERFRVLLTEYNKKCNLTSVLEEKEIFYKHFLDSAAGAFLFPEGARVAEVGSGGGFPSIPLKLVREDLKFTLFESTGKKCDFLRLAVRELGLKEVTVENIRAEEAGRGKYRAAFDVCCARAVARMNTLAEYCLPLVGKGGRMIAYKGNVGEELAEARRAVELLGGGRMEMYPFSLPEGMGERTLVCIYKERETPARYPRGRGKERSAPIV